MRDFADKLYRVVLARPWLTLALMLAFGGVCATVASGLQFDTRFDALLHDDVPELMEVRELQKRAGGTVQLMIAIGGKKAGRLPFARKVVTALQKQPYINYATAEYPVEFFKKRRIWFLPLADLRTLEQLVSDEVDAAKARANPLYVDLEDDDEKKDGWAEVAKLKKRAENQGDLIKRTIESPDGKYLFVRAKPSGTSYDMAAGQAMFKKIQMVVSAQHPERFGVTVRYAGALALNQEQHSRMNQDLKKASIIALVLILLLMTVYIRKLIAPLILAIPLLTGLAITLAITKLTIGQLNLVSGFLVSALIGLGIDYEIHLYLRYLEELDRGFERLKAMQRAVVATFSSCVTAALTTAAAFFAIAIANFRGFREYGLIAGSGVLITLSTTFIMMPPLAFMLSRTGKRGLRLFATTGFRRGLAAAMVAVGTAFVVYSFIVAPQVKWRTNFREVRGKSENVDFTVYVERSLGGSLSPAGIFVENVVRARKVMAYLDPLTKSKNSGVQRAISLASMVPKDAAQKVKLIARMRRKLASIAHRKLEAKDRKNVDEALALVKTRPWTIDDVPRVFRRAFETVDGSGQFVVVWPRSEMVEDKEIIAWGKELDRIRSELRARDIPAMILGENRVGARVLQEMRDDAPTIIIAATIAVLLILITDTRSPRAVLLISGSLGVGILWMLGMMHLLDLQINVFNQAVLATVIGLGLDNAVHMQHRYAEEGHGSLPKVVATTGAASFLASATTAIGFGAAVIAHHGGIQSLGWLALVGFTSTFVSSTVFFPAVLRLLECASPLGCAETEWTDGVVQGAQKGSPDQGS